MHDDLPQWKQELPEFPHKLVNDLATLLTDFYKEHIRRDVNDGNGRAVKAQYEAQIPRAYLPALVAAACYMRTLTNIQGAVLLIMRGLDAPGRILLRAAMESLFKLKAVEQDRNVVNAILAGDDLHRKGLLKKYKRIDDPDLQAELERIGELKSPAADSFKEWGVTPLTVEQMAEKADMTKLYLSTYPVLSDAAHAGIRDLERHIETDHTGEVIALHNEPSIDNLETLFLMATEFLSSALEGFAEIVKLDLDDFCEVSKGALKQLADAHRPPKGSDLPADVGPL